MQVLLVAMESVHSPAGLRVLSQSSEDLAAAILSCVQSAPTASGAPQGSDCAAETDLCAGSCHHTTSWVSAEHFDAGERVYTLWNIIALNDSDVRGRRRSSSRGMHGAALSGVLSGTGHRH